MKHAKTNWNIRPWALAMGLLVIALTSSWVVAQCCGGGRSVVSAAGRRATAVPVAAKSPMRHDGHMAKSKQASQANQIAKISAALNDLSAAEAAIKAGKTKAALTELAKVRGTLEALRDRAKPAAGGGTVNSKCPIMGGKFDPNKVKPNLVQEYKGGKVGFCCAMCIPKWNKLSTAAKDKKLASVVQPK